jgi:hypothetical protein
VTGGLKGDEDDDDTDAVMKADRVSKLDSDSDLDNDAIDNQGKGYRDVDDHAFLTWGRPASGRDARELIALTKRYYAAAAADDGAKACSLTYTLFAEAIPEDYGQPPGPPTLRGSTCRAVLVKLFAQERHQLRDEASSLRVTGVRVQGQQGRALLGSSAMPASALAVRREKDSWKVMGVLAGPLP